MRRITGLLLAVAITSCATDNPGDPPGEKTAAIRVLHAVTSVPSIDILVDGQVVLAGLAAGSASAYLPVADGARSVGFRAAGSGGTPLAHTLSLDAGDSITILTVDSSSVLNPWVLTDTGGVVPATRSKLRALHFAESAPAIDIWRTQPDWQDPITFMFPHNYREVTPYMESDPGLWRVLVSTLQRAGGVPALQDTLLLTDAITVPAGESRTVVVLDAPGGGLTYQVITP